MFFFSDEECQRLGIKFIPPSRQKRPTSVGVESDGEEKKFSTNPEDSGDESEAESVDSFSDLYPGETLGKGRGLGVDGVYRVAPL